MPATNLKTSSHNWCSQRRSTNELLSSVTFLLFHHFSSLGCVHYNCTIQDKRTYVVGRHQKRSKARFPFPRRKRESPPMTSPPFQSPRQPHLFLAVMRFPPTWPQRSVVFRQRAAGYPRNRLTERKRDWEIERDSPVFV